MANTQILEQYKSIVTAEIATELEDWLGIKEYAKTANGKQLTVAKLVREIKSGKQLSGEYVRFQKRMGKPLISLLDLLAIDDPDKSHKPIRRLVFSLFPELLEFLKIQYTVAGSGPLSRLVDFAEDASVPNTEDLLVADDTVVIPRHNTYLDGVKVLCAVHSDKYNSDYFVVRNVPDAVPLIEGAEYSGKHLETRNVPWDLKKRGYTIIKMANPKGLSTVFSPKEREAVDQVIDCLTDVFPPLGKKRKYLADLFETHDFYFCQPDELSQYAQDNLSACGLGLAGAEAARRRRSQESFGKTAQHFSPETQVGRTGDSQQGNTPVVQVKPNDDLAPDRTASKGGGPSSAAVQEYLEQRAQFLRSAQNDARPTRIQQGIKEKSSRTRVIALVAAVLLAALLLPRLFSEDKQAESNPVQQEGSIEQVQEIAPEDGANDGAGAADGEDDAPVEETPESIEKGLAENAVPQNPYEELLGTWTGVLVSIDSYGPYCYAGEDAPLILTIKDASKNGRLTVDIQAMYHNHKEPENTVMTYEGDILLDDHDVFLQYGEKMEYSFDVSDYGGINPSCKVVIEVGEGGTSLSASVNSFPSLVFYAANQTDYYTLTRQ